MGCSTISNNLVRKKTLSDYMEGKEVKKELTLLDLVFLAIGAMVGSGVYEVTGSVAHHVAGPSVVLSFVIAALATAFSAITYAEFAARIPFGGSAYQFTYIAIGEVWAYIIGWSVYAEHVVTVSAISKACSGYLDGLFNHSIARYLTENTQMPAGGLLNTYPDLLAGGIAVVLYLFVATGIKIPPRINMFCETLNLVVLFFIFCTGMVLSKGEYWTKEGAFFPFGWSGTISGASALVFSYVGFEVVAAETERATNPNRDIPLSLMISLIVALLVYVGAASALTLMVPWQSINTASPFPSAYSSRGWEWAKYIVSIGALIAMISTVVGNAKSCPHGIQSLAEDGLVVPIFKKTSEETGEPIVATFVSGLISVILALVFPLYTMIEFISLGHLINWTFLAVWVIKLRYEPNLISRYETFVDKTNFQPGELDNRYSFVETHTNDDKPTTSGKKPLLERSVPRSGYQSTHERVSNAANVSNPLNEDDDSAVAGVVKDSVLNSKLGFLFRWTLKFHPGEIPFYLLLISIFFSFISLALLTFGYSFLKEWWFILLFIFIVILAAFPLFLMGCFNQDKRINTFKVPFVPLFPFLGILINWMLIINLEHSTWIRFLISQAIGLFIYFAYGYHHSKAKKSE